MNLVLELTALLVGVLVLNGVANRFRVSAPLLLMLAGLLVSFLPIPNINLSPELVLLGLLPPLLYSSAATSSLVDFRRNLSSIGWLSVGLVLFTMLGTGVVVHQLLPVSWAVAFAVGAIVAPPDAVAASAVAKAIGLPRRVTTVLEGESLVNDATALVSLNTAVAAITVAVTWHGVLLDFVIAVVGAVVVGLLVAKVVAVVYRLVSDVLIGSALSFLVPYVAYVPAEEIHASGVLAVVVAGLALGHWGPRAAGNGQVRLTNRVNWTMIQFLLESTVFLLLGLQASSIVSAVRTSTVGLGRVVVTCLATLAAVIALRLLWVAGTRLFVHAARRPSTPAREALVIGWAGMRGVVTLAAALTLPDTLTDRPVLILIAMAVVVGTLVLQGTTLPAMARALKLSGPDPREDALQEAVVYQRASRLGIAASRAAMRPGDEAVMDRMEETVTMRANAVWERLGRPSEDAETPSDAYRRLRTIGIQAEREEVLRTRDAGEVDHEVVTALLATLDMEETSLQRVEARTERVRNTPLRPRIPESPCVHLRDAPWGTAPRSPDCRECVAEGTTPVHLRMCLTCGHVGCCDSSPGRHAERHFHESQHPVMRSFEPGESWRWCYVDELTGAGSEN